MSLPFDTAAENAKLQMLREEEQEDLARIMAEKYSLPYTDLSIIPVNMDALRVIPESDAVRAHAIAFDKNGKHLSLAISEPNDDALSQLVAHLESETYIVEKYLISERSLERGLSRYADLSQASHTLEGVFTIPDALPGAVPVAGDLGSVRAHLTQMLTGKHRAQVSELFETILSAAFTLSASDIHFEPEEASVRLRFRLDGVLTDVFSLDEHAYKLINSRIKILSGLKLNITDRAQDGRFSVQIKGTEVEIRTSIIPGNYGESVVLRVLDPSAISHSLDTMGIEPKLLARLRAEIKRPNGMLLNTGPTGSGKTTMLYAFLQEVYTPGIKIITIEDPVEYHLPGIVQTQVSGTDYTFASGLRSVLRQDPDIIMVGEIRDAEVAETAIQAALTGHFVFSTLHTNDAAGAFPRLVDLQADPKTFASAVTVAMAQRLVRTLNPATRLMRATTEEEKQLCERIFSTLTDPTLRPRSFDTVGQAVSQGEDTGYKGRTGVYEAIFMTDALGELLRSNPAVSDIRSACAGQGFLTMAQDGLRKALTGETSLEEVLSVVDIPRT